MEHTVSPWQKLTSSPLLDQFKKFLELGVKFCEFQAAQGATQAPKKLEGILRSGQVLDRVGHALAQAKDPAEARRIQTTYEETLQRVRTPRREPPRSSRPHPGGLLRAIPGGKARAPSPQRIDSKKSPPPGFSRRWR